ncbi:MAG: phage major capsid protein [Thermoguttaceae bacterium]|nr:phage major capsid protein [Thermoguttaceae bacterium]
MSGPTAQDIVGAQPRVKKPSERYCTTKATAVHSKTGKPVVFDGMEVKSQSELELAKVGTWFKCLMRGNRRLLGEYGAAIPTVHEHEQELFKEMLSDGLWCGPTGPETWTDGAKLSQLGLPVKALLDDATSGGVNIVPAEFDTTLITYALLNGEILPHVEVRPVSRSRVETAAVQTPTVQWGTYEGSQISLFDTDDLISPLTATIRPVTSALVLGRDFEADSPVSIGATLQQLLGERFTEEMDRVICVGNGVDRPLGIFNTPGATEVPSEGGVGEANTFADFLSLLFAIGKQYRRQDLRPCFLSNDTTYARSRGIAVDPSDPTTDQRPVFGLAAVNSYMTLEWPHRIQNDIPNTHAAFVCLRKYRLWRRQGFEFRLVSEDKELALKNEILIVARGRCAGQIVNGEALAIMPDCQA